MSNIEIREMLIQDYKEILLLWQGDKGIGLSNADSQENIKIYLQRNPGLSFIATEDSNIIGAVLCGHDGRRGYLHHLTVATTHRHQGIGKRLVENCLTKLQSIGIQKCHVHVYANNFTGQRFWTKIGWTDRKDLKVLSKDIDVIAERSIRL